MPTTYKCGFGFDLDNGQQRRIRILEIVGHGFVGEGLGRERRAESTVALGWELGRGDEALRVVDGVDQRNDYAVSTTIQGAYGPVR